MNRLIRSKVARILNSREVAIAAGSLQGVCIGMYFDILDPKGEDICDPDSGEKLGSIERVKIRVKITHVQEKLSVGSTLEKEVDAEDLDFGSKGSIGASIGLLSRALIPQTEKKYQTLKIGEKKWEDLDEEQSYVKTGDPVIQVVA